MALDQIAQLMIGSRRLATLGFGRLAEPTLGLIGVQFTAHGSVNPRQPKPLRRGACLQNATIRPEAGLLSPLDLAALKRHLDDVGAPRPETGFAIGEIEAPQTSEAIIETRILSDDHVPSAFETLTCL